MEASGFGCPVCRTKGTKERMEKVRIVETVGNTETTGIFCNIFFHNFCFVMYIPDRLSRKIVQMCLLDEKRSIINSNCLSCLVVEVSGLNKRMLRSGCVCMCRERRKRLPFKTKRRSAVKPVWYRLPRKQVHCVVIIIIIRNPTPDDVCVQDLRRFNCCA